MYEGAVVRELAGEALTTSNLVEAAVGIVNPDSPVIAGERS